MTPTDATRTADGPAPDSGHTDAPDAREGLRGAITPETIAELRRRALLEGHDAAHYPTSVAVPTKTLTALLDAAERLAEVREQVTRGALCPMCSTGMSRRTVGMVCQICGTDYASPEYANLRRDSQETSETLIADALAVRAERDELAASVARVRAALDSHPDPTCDEYASKGPISCGWKSALIDVRWALADGSGS